MTRFFLPLTLLLLAPAIFAQDLNRLRSRSEELWKYRVAGDRTKAAPFVAPGSKNRFSELFDPFLKEANIVGFSFTKDSREVFVNVRMRVGLPVGEMNKEIEERWQWTSGNWFLNLEPLASSSLFTGNLPAYPGVPRVNITVAEPRVEPGNYVQGAKIAGSIPFQAKKAEILAIDAVGIPGLTVKELHWQNESGGTIEFVIDTTLISQNVAQPVTFVAVGHGGIRTPAKPVVIRATISGLVEFRQIPQVIDYRVAGKAQIEMKNLGNRPIVIKDVIASRLEYKIKEIEEAKGGTVLRILPGETGRLTVEYPQQLESPEVNLLLSFVDGPFPEPIPLPLGFFRPEVEERPLVDPAVLQEFLRSQRRPPI
jgi:hypothetical protein